MKIGYNNYFAFVSHFFFSRKIEFHFIKEKTLFVQNNEIRALFCPPGPMPALHYHPPLHLHQTLFALLALTGALYAIKDQNESFIL